MKHCEKCGNKMQSGFAFCPQCGTRQLTSKDQFTSIPHANFYKYRELKITDIYKRELELTPEGVHIFRRKSLLWGKYDILIPYSQIKAIELQKASLLNKGYFSIITKNAGIRGIRPPYSMRDADLIANDTNTIMFSKNKTIMEIYNAINELCRPEMDAKRLLEDNSNNRNNTNVSPVYDRSTFDTSFDEMSGREFEFFCADILRKNGFEEVRVTPGSGDQGVDILATKASIKYAIQCKKYASPLSNTPIQEVHAGKAFYNCHVGVVMTNSTFTPKAKELAEATGVLTWDMAELKRMMVVAGVEHISELPLKSKETHYHTFDIDSILNEIQDFIDDYSDNLENLEGVLEQFVESIELFDYQKGPIDKEMIRLGKSIYAMADGVNHSTICMCEKFMTIFGYLKKHGYDGWSNDEESMDGIAELQTGHNSVFNSLGLMQQTIENMGNKFSIRPSIYEDAKRQASQDISDGIILMKKSNENFEMILSQYREMKEDC